MKTYDITFVGHLCFDEITPYHGETSVAPGSAVLCGAIAAARIGQRVAIVTRMAPADEQILQPLNDLGVETLVVPASETTYAVVIHPTPNVDERILKITRSAGFFTADDMPAIATRDLHLAGISDQEFTLDFIRELKARGYRLSVDMQSFVRQVDPLTRNIAFKDVLQKYDIVKLMSRVKLDVVEAKVLTGTDDLEQAARQFEAWGSPETVITHAEGVLAHVNGKTYYEKFSNRSSVGRTGRGDTTFAAYLARRSDHDVAESLKFAAALVSIKMETPGPFRGTLADVMTRMEQEE
ncbi:PfkB domain protein [Candidatus Vecturithrix granuli]|uniref:PfkB domain protein n=1 Tax=Vecturithrix granuli TaxID=1499967 RepID=A0A081C2X3_VECG1|nr:PfkB domain protein [Candidatus Vecturithrix granuli]